MKVILGRYMDGGAWPDAVSHFGGGKQAVDGARLCGPAGFLSLLEEKLGLPARDAHGSVRIAAWEGLLRQRVPASSQEGEPFYAASFRSDSWNTAKRVLQMRDELKAAGALEEADELVGQGRRLADTQPRLAEFLLLEAEQHRAQAAPGPADRLRAVIDELAFQAEGENPLRGRLSVTLATPEDCWQAPWRTLFRLLRTCGVGMEQTPPLFPGAALTKNAVAAFPLFQSGTGLHLELEAANLPEAAEALAAALRARLLEGGAGDIVLLRGENSVELDGALERHGLPGTGCRNRSTARPFVQLLPLYLRLQLLPFDPHTLRQFLLLPVCPVEAGLRRKALRALQREEFAPGTSTMERWPRQWKAAFSQNGIVTGELREQAAWLCPPRPVESGLLSRNDIEACARKLKDWAENTALPPQPKTAELCRRLMEAARRIPDSLTPLAFEKLLDSVLGDGENSAEKRRACPWKLISDPGQIWKDLHPADTVIWWDFTDDGSALRDSSAWSDGEKAWLEQHDCAPFDIDRERRARAHAMAAPFRFAARLITVRPRFHGPEEALPHPMQAFLPRNGTVRVSASAVLTGREETQGFFRLSDREVLAPAPAAAPWTAEKGTPLQVPESVGPSGIETVLACPAQWYFRNVLGLDSDRNELGDEHLACGDLAHEVMERLLKEWRDEPTRYERGGLKERISTLLREHAHSRAARLALPEYTILREGMAGRLARSFIGFCEKLEQEGLVFLDSEQTYKGRVGETECTGRYDLLLSRKGSSVPCVVADMKWSRRRIYEEQAEEGTAVQLAAYHHLLETGRKVTGWKDGRPVLADPAPVTLEKAWFFLLPDARIHESRTPLGEQWRNVEQRWADMCAALASGRLPLAGYENEAPGDRARNTKNDSPCPHCAYGKLCGRTPDEADGGTEDKE